MARLSLNHSWHYEIMNGDPGVLIVGAPTLGIGFEGGTYSHLFYVADVEASGEAVSDEVHVALDATDFLAVFPLRGVGRARLVGEASSELVSVCARHKLPLHVFPWSQNTAAAGLNRNAAYLVRPDGYVALADPAGSAATITSYLNAHELLLTG